MSEENLAILFALLVAVGALGVGLVALVGLRLHVEANPRGYPHGRSAA